MSSKPDKPTEGTPPTPIDASARAVELQDYVELQEELNKRKSTIKRVACDLFVARSTIRWLTEKIKGLEALLDEVVNRVESDHVASTKSSSKQIEELVRALAQSQDKAAELEGTVLALRADNAILRQQAAALHAVVLRGLGAAVPSREGVDETTHALAGRAAAARSEDDD